MKRERIHCGLDGMEVSRIELDYDRKVLSPAWLYRLIGPRI
jgi:hypothetical protein